MRKLGLLVHTWLLLDFFGDARREGREGSALTTAIFGQSFAAFLLAAIMFEPSLPIARFAAANLSLSTLLVGIAALADPEQESRKLADRQLFATAPMPHRTLAIARALHGALRTGFLAVGVGIPPAVLCSFLRDGGIWSAPAYLGLAVLLAATTAGALQIAVRAVARFAGELRAALAAGTLRALLFALLFAGFIVGLPALRRGAEVLPIDPVLLFAWPPYLAARLLSGIDAGYCAVALLCLVMVLLLLDDLVGTTVADRRSRAGTHDRHGVFAKLEARLSGEGPLRAMTDWVATMLFRSAAFRARVLPLVGLPATMLAVSFANENAAGREMLLGVAMLLPAIGMPFLVAFLPRAEQSGADLVFVTSPSPSVALAREGALVALTVRVLLPLQTIGAIALLAFDRAPLRAIDLLLFGAGASILGAAFALRRLSVIPFTATDDDPSGLELGALVPPAMALSSAGAGFGLIANGPYGPPLALLAAALGMRRLTLGIRTTAQR